jgi:hypothetical protein
VQGRGLGRTGVGIQVNGGNLSENCCLLLIGVGNFFSSFPSSLRSLMRNFWWNSMKSARKTAQERRKYRHECVSGQSHLSSFLWDLLSRCKSHPSLKHSQRVFSKFLMKIRRKTSTWRFINTQKAMQNMFFVCFHLRHISKITKALIKNEFYVSSVQTQNHLELDTISGSFFTYEMCLRSLLSLKSRRDRWKSKDYF